MTPPTDPAGYVLYSRDGCHLCEMAEQMLEQQGLAYRRVEISGDEELEAKYGWDVPVLTRAGRTLIKGVFTAQRVRNATSAESP